MAESGKKVSKNLLKTFVRRSSVLVVISCFALSVLIPALMYYDDLEHFKAESIFLIDRFIEKDLNFNLRDMLTDESLKKRMGAPSVGRFSRKS